MSKLKFAAYPAIVLLSLAAALSAHAAGDVTTDNSATQLWSQTKSRAQVQQDLFAARAAGTVQVGEVGSNPLATITNSGRTRAQVLAEVRASRAEMAGMTGEDSGSFYLSQQRARQDKDRVLAGSVKTPQ